MTTGQDPTITAYAIENRARLQRATQECLDCRQHFDVTAIMRTALEDDAKFFASGARVGFEDFVDVTCPRCGKTMFLYGAGQCPPLQRLEFENTPS